MSEGIKRGVFSRSNACDLGQAIQRVVQKWLGDCQKCKLFDPML